MADLITTFLSIFAILALGFISLALVYWVAKGYNPIKLFLWFIGLKGKGDL